MDIEVAVISKIRSNTVPLYVVVYIPLMLSPQIIVLCSEKEEIKGITTIKFPNES